ncbi:MAG: transporter substrate-binding domain-containing protein [Chitinispirillales bacterium]|jgi:PAS domain S-box-containing protein|nr:transporter substrate-binding domain-containing protein [Chitinispirillales bacterium]
MRERIVCLLIAVAFLPPLDSGSRHSGAPSMCGEAAIRSFYEVPGVTGEEAQAIEARVAGGDTLVYGTTPSAESFVGENGEVCGFTARICEWMSALFGIPVKPVIYSRENLIDGLDKGEIDFTGEFTVTEERLETYFMTDAIAKRAIKYFVIEGSPPFDEIARQRPLRCAFLPGTATWRAVAASFSGVRFDTVFVDNSLRVYGMLKSGEIDAFFSEAHGEYAFDAYGDVAAHSFVPLIYEPVSLATRNPALAPFISVMQKAISSGGSRHLTQMYNCGRDDYMKRKMAARLTDAERAYIRGNPVVRFAAEYDNYPVSFYNVHEREWQGIAFDVMKEAGRLTGLKFERANARKAEWPELLELLKSGEAAMVTELVRTEDKEREGQFLWSKKPILIDSYVLVSKAGYPNLSLNEILNARVALMKQAAYTEQFNRWFPGHANSVEYDNYELAVAALTKGEVDMVMSSRKELVSLINYNEHSGYKANVIFDQPLESTFGFGANEGVLAGIIDKALGIMEVGAISDNWMYKTYDYRAKVAEAQRPWFMGAALLALAVLALILAMFYKSRTIGKRLVKLVAEKTSTLTAIFNATPDLILCKDLKSRITECNKAVEDYFDSERSGIIGKDDAAAFGMPQDVVKRYVALDKQIFKSKQAVTVEESIPASGGQAQIFETIKSPLIQDGRVTGLVAMSRDITSRKATEEEAKSASKAKSLFVANMSHEMRTPMNVIVGLTGLMLEDDGTPCYLKETLKKVSTAGDTLMGLINNVLDISKIEAGKLELMPVLYETASLINDIVTLNMIRIEDKPVTFTLDIEEDLPSMMVGDDLRVKQVLNNLLSNAFKYTKEGNVTLSVNYRLDCGDVWVTFRIIDTGIGIRDEDIAKLFTDYNQVDALANREIEGTGLGLSITKKIVEQMDGDITVESEYGKGTAFCVTIRQTFATEKPIGKETAENLRSFRYADKRKHAHEKLSRPNLSYANALVVDDFPTNLDVAAGMLR